MEPRFQSLTGRLKTRVSSTPTASVNMFQSLTGRLKTVGGQWRVDLDEVVSIPHR